MKKLLFILSLILFIGCNDYKHSDNNSEQTNELTINKTVNSSDSTNIQYNIKWDNINHSPVDIRIITLSKDGETHDYVVANNYIGRAGGLDIEHWAGCNCFKNR